MRFTNLFTFHVQSSFLRKAGFRSGNSGSSRHFPHGIGRGAVRDPQKPGPGRRNAHRIGSFPSLAFSGGVSGIPAGQRTGNRSHAQQPHHQPGRGLLLSPGSRGFRTGPTLLIGDERPGKHCRGDGHGTFAVLDRQGEPTHFAGAIRVRIKHVAGSQGNARRRGWEPESPFSGTRPFSAGRDGARIPRNTWKARDAFATRRHPARGEIRSAVRPRCLVPERVGLAITRDGESIERTDVNRILGHDPLPVFCRIHMESPAASNKSCPPAAVPFHRWLPMSRRPEMPPRHRSRLPPEDHRPRGPCAYPRTSTRPHLRKELIL